MDATDIKVYEIFKNRFSDQEAEVVMTYIEDKTTEKAEQHAKTLASQSDILKLRQDVQTDLVKLRQDVQHDLGNLRKEVQTDLGKLRQEFQTDLGKFRQDFQTDLGKFRQDTHTDLLKLDSKITDLRAEMKAEMSNTKTDIVRWLVVTMIASAGLIIAVVKLF